MAPGLSTRPEFGNVSEELASKKGRVSRGQYRQGVPYHRSGPVGSCAGPDGGHRTSVLSSSRTGSKVCSEPVCSGVLWTLEVGPEQLSTIENKRPRALAFGANVNIVSCMRGEPGLTFSSRPLANSFPISRRLFSFAPRPLTVKIGETDLYPIGSKQRIERGVESRSAICVRLMHFVARQSWETGGAGSFRFRRKTPNYPENHSSRLRDALSSKRGYLPWHRSLDL